MDVSVAKSTKKKSEDVLSQMLNAMRVSGNLLLKEQYVTPWAVSVPNAVELNTLLNISSGVRIAAFHLVEKGQVIVALENGETLCVEEGELLICFSGLGHVLSQGEVQSPIEIQELISGDGNRFKPKISEFDTSTSLVCGMFLLEKNLFNPLLSALPTTLKVSPKDNIRLNGVIALLSQEFKTASVANDFVISRYLELLCAEAIRSHVNELTAKSANWLSALKDPVIGRAIEIIHSQLAYRWTVKSLAAYVALSPSRFAARFTSSLGEPPMIYITKQRMSVASVMLESKQKSIEQIANHVGYESLAAFSRAFKRSVGLSPAAWRSKAKQ